MKQQLTFFAIVISGGFTSSTNHTALFPSDRMGVEKAQSVCEEAPGTRMVVSIIL